MGRRGWWGIAVSRVLIAIARNAVMSHRIARILAHNRQRGGSAGRLGWRGNAVILAIVAMDARNINLMSEKKK